MALKGIGVRSQLSHLSLDRITSPHLLPVTKFMNEDNGIGELFAHVVTLSIGSKTLLQMLTLKAC